MKVLQTLRIRRCQYTVRTLLVLMLVVSVACSWLAVGIRRANKQREALASLLQPCELGYIDYDYELDPCGNRVPNPRLPGPAWLHRLLGDDFFRTVASLRFERDITSQNLPLLRTLDSVRIVRLGNNSITEAGAKYLSDLRHLEQLHLWRDSNVSDSWLRHLNAPGLRVLNIESTAVTDAGLDVLISTPDLQSLRLSGTQVSDRGLKNLGGLSRLTELGIADTNITDSGMKSIEKLNQLRYLDLTMTRITDKGMAYLKGLTRLEDLSLAFTSVTDVGMDDLKGLRLLRRLDLRGTRISDRGLASLEGLKQLRVLSITECNITDAGAKYLWGLSSLRMVFIGGTRISDRAVEELHRKLPLADVTRKTSPIL
jgi:Leucine-rich repeat (LRR) protein